MRTPEFHFLATCFYVAIVWFVLANVIGLIRYTLAHLALKKGIGVSKKLKMAAERARLSVSNLRSFVIASTGFADIKREYSYRQRKFVFTPLFRRDYMFYLLVVFPSVFGAFEWVRYSATWYSLPRGSSWIAVSNTALPLVFAFVNLLFCIRVPSDVSGVRQIFGMASFVGCIVWAPPRLTTLVPILCSKEILQTGAKGEAAEFTLIVQLGQGEPDPNDESDPPHQIPFGHTDEQYVSLTFTGTLDPNMPTTLIETYFSEAATKKGVFKRKKGETRNEAVRRAYFAIIVPMITRYIVAAADGPLQGFYVAELFTRVGIANARLTKKLRPIMRKIGFYLESAAIGSVQDVKKGGQIETNSEANRAERERDAAIRTAAATEEARKRQAIANQEAGKAEQNAIKAVLMVKRENAEIAAQVDLAELIAGLAAVPDAGAALRAFILSLQSMTADEKAKVIRSFTEGLLSKLERVGVVGDPGIAGAMRTLERMFTQLPTDTPKVPAA